MFLKRDHFKRKTVLQPAICHRICDFSGGSRRFWHQRSKFGDGSPTSPVSHTCLVSKRPDLVRWLKKHCYTNKCWDWGNTGCMVPCENIQTLSPNLQTIWNQVKYHIHCHPGVTSLTVLQSYLYVAPMFWAQLAIFLLGCWRYECCDRVQCTRYRCPKCYGVNFQLLHKGLLGRFLAKGVDKFVSKHFFSLFTSHAMTLIKLDWTAFSLLWASPTMCAQMQRIRRH